MSKTMTFEGFQKILRENEGSWAQVFKYEDDQIKLMNKNEPLIRVQKMTPNPPVDWVHLSDGKNQNILRYVAYHLWSLHESDEYYVVVFANAEDDVQYEMNEDILHAKIKMKELGGIENQSSPPYFQLYHISKTRILP